MYGYKGRYLLNIGLRNINNNLIMFQQFKIPHLLNLEDFNTELLYELGSHKKESEKRDPFTFSAQCITRRDKSFPNFKASYFKGEHKFKIQTSLDQHALAIKLKYQDKFLFRFLTPSLHELQHNFQIGFRTQVLPEYKLIEGFAFEYNRQQHYFMPQVLFKTEFAKSDWLINLGARITKQQAFKFEPKAFVKTILDGKSISLSLYLIEILSEPEQYEFIINQEGGEKQNFAFCVQQKKQSFVEWILGLEHKIDSNWNGLLKMSTSGKGLVGVRYRSEAVVLEMLNKFRLNGKLEGFPFSLSIQINQ